MNGRRRKQKETDMKTFPLTAGNAFHAFDISQCFLFFIIVILNDLS